MTCKEIRERLIFFLDGELALSETHRIESHLDACQECSTVAASEGNFRETLGGMEYHRTPPGLETRIRSALDAGKDRSRFAWGMAWLLSRQVLGAAVAVLFVALVVVSRPGLREAGGTPEIFSTLEAATGSVKGELVCAGCAPMGVSIEDQRHCRKFGHVTGLRAGDGTIWRFVERPKISDLLYDPPRRGTRVDVEGRIYQEIQYIDVARLSDI